MTEEVGGCIRTVPQGDQNLNAYSDQIKGEENKLESGTSLARHERPTVKVFITLLI